MKATYHHVLETVALHTGPVLHLIGWYIFSVACDIIAGISIRAFGTDRSHQLVIFIWNIVFRSHLRQTVYLVIDRLALCRVCDMAILFIAVFDAVKQRCFFYRVGSSVLFCPLKHQMFQIVGQSCRFCRVIT